MRTTIKMLIPLIVLIQSCSGGKTVDSPARYGAIINPSAEVVE